MVDRHGLGGTTGSWAGTTSVRIGGAWDVGRGRSRGNGSREEGTVRLVQARSEGVHDH